MTIPVPLPPDLPGFDVTLARVEGLRPNSPEPLKGGGALTLYRETLEGSADCGLRAKDGTPVARRQGNLTYLGAWLDDAGWDRFVADISARAGLPVMHLTGGLRVRDAADARYSINPGAVPSQTPDGPVGAADVLRIPHVQHTTA